MPYITCEHCGLPGFVSRGWTQPPECPHCGRSVGGGRDRVAPEEVIAGSLDLLRDVLEMDVAMLTEVRSGHEVVRHAAGEWPGVPDMRGVSAPLHDTFCAR